ncbi:MAG: hypothetical protein R2734_04885 [Nocardioides sp.]
MIAEHRDLYHAPSRSCSPSDAMDGLTSEADVAFLLTSNRPDLRRRR